MERGKGKGSGIMAYLIPSPLGRCQQKEKIGWQEGFQLGWMIFIFVVPHQFSQDIG